MVDFQQKSNYSIDDLIEIVKLLRGEGTAEDAARRIQSRASLYMTEQYG